MVSNLNSVFMILLFLFSSNYIVISAKCLSDSRVNVYKNYNNLCIESVLTTYVRGCLVASHSLPHFILGIFDQVGKCLVDN